MQQKKKSEDARSKLLMAAYDCFARFGYEQTGVAQICSQAGFSKGAFYHHFESKQEIFLDLFRLFMSGMNDQFQQCVESKEPALEKLLKLERLLTDLIVQAQDKMPIFLDFYSQALRDKQIWAMFVAPYTDYHAILTDLIQQGIEEGSFRKVEPENAAGVLMSTGLGLLFRSMVSDSEQAWDTQVRAAMDLFMESLKKKE